MTSNSCNFMGKYFTQVDGATIGGPESASLTDIYGAVFIDSKIEENIISEMKIRSGIEMTVFQYLYKLVRKGKLRKQNG